MNAFQYRDGALCAEQRTLASIAAEFGTPCYVYSRAALEAGFRQFSTPCAGRDALVCYAVKANSNLAVLDVFARIGAGFDIVSEGELARVLAAGGCPQKTLFPGGGKTEAEMRRALAAGILCFNIESAAELERLDALARSMNLRAPVSFRVNPDVDAKTHPYISTGLRDNKFGIAHEDVLPLYRRAATLGGIRIKGIDCHIG